MGEPENTTSTSHWFQGMGGEAGTALELAPGWVAHSPGCHSSLYQVLVQWGDPRPSAQLPGLASPSPGSESLHPLPLGGLGVCMGGVGLGLAGMCGAGGWESRG